MKNIWVLILVLTSCLSNPTEKNNNENSNLDGSNENSNLPNVVYTQKQIDSINDAKISPLLNKRLFYHAWRTTENSFPGDVQDRGLNNLVVRTNPTEDESDIIMKLNKNHSFSITFKPIYCQEHVTIKGTWKWNENSIIELNKNVIASTKVICMDFPGADPLDEYIYVSKFVNIEDGYIVLDVRETKRCSFFAHMAIVNQGGEKEINEADYAYSVLDQLSLGTDLITQYIQYLK